MFSNDKRSRRKEFILKLSRQMFPYRPGKKAIWTKDIDVFVEYNDFLSPDEITLQYKVDPRYGHLIQDECDGDAIEIQCVKSENYPDLYHGILKIHLGPIVQDKATEFGKFIFSEHAPKEVTNLYFLMSYEALA